MSDKVYETTNTRHRLSRSYFAQKYERLYTDKPFTKHRKSLENTSVQVRSLERLSEKTRDSHRENYYDLNRTIDMFSRSALDHSVGFRSQNKSTVEKAKTGALPVTVSLRD